MVLITVDQSVIAHIQRDAEDCGISPSEIEVSHPAYRDYVFFQLNNRKILPVLHESYVALMHRIQPMHEYANRCVRVAIFYVEVADFQPVAVVNATYNLIEFDASGYAHPPPSKHSIQDNRAFFETVRRSLFDDIDNDPEVQKLRKNWGEDFSWLPSSMELNFMLRSIFSFAGQDSGSNYKKGGNGI